MIRREAPWLLKASGGVLLAIGLIGMVASVLTLGSFVYFSYVSLWYTSADGTPNCIETCYSNGQEISGINVKLGTTMTVEVYRKTDTPKTEIWQYVEATGFSGAVKIWNGGTGKVTHFINADTSGYRRIRVCGYNNDGATVDFAFFSIQVIGAPSKYKLYMLSPEGNGTVDPSPGTQEYTAGVQVLIRAFPASGWAFDHWIIDGQTNTSSSVYLSMNTDHTVKAYFSQLPPSPPPPPPPPPPPMYTLTTKVQPPTAGYVTPASGTYQEKTRVSLTATANSGWRFAYWSGGASGTSNPTDIIMDSNKEVTANFTYGTAPSVSFYINDQRVGENSSIYLGTRTMKFRAESDRELGSVSVSISGTANATISLSSSDNKIWTADPWTAPGDGQYNVTVRATYVGGGEVKVCSVDFAYGEVSAPPGKTALVFNIDPGDGGSVLVVSPEGQTVVDENTAVTVQAFPNAGYRFKGWGGGVMGKDRSLTFTAKGSSMMIIATFEKEVPLTEKAVGLVKENIFKILTAAGLVMVVSGELLERRRT
jgi:hypothetical protein